MRRAPSGRFAPVSLPCPLPRSASCQADRRTGRSHRAPTRTTNGPTQCSRPARPSPRRSFAARHMGALRRRHVRCPAALASTMSGRAIPGMDCRPAFAPPRMAPFCALMCRRVALARCVLWALCCRATSAMSSCCSRACVSRCTVSPMSLTGAVAPARVSVRDDHAPVGAHHAP